MKKVFINDDSIEGTFEILESGIGRLRMITKKSWRCKRLWREEWIDSEGAKEPLVIQHLINEFKKKLTP